MKYASVFVLALVFNSNYLVAMENQEQKKQQLLSDSKENELSADETKHFNWFREQHPKLATHPLKKLSAEDQKAFSNEQLSLERIMDSRSKYVDAFWGLVEQAKIDRDGYHKDVLKIACVKTALNMRTGNVPKPTDEISAKTYVFTKQLSKEEQDTWMKDAYLTILKAAMPSVTKWSDGVANWLADLKQIENTQEAKEQKSDELFKAKIVELTKAYLN